MSAQPREPFYKRAEEILAIVQPAITTAEARARQAERERVSDLDKRRWEIDNDNKRMLALLRTLSNPDEDAEIIAANILVKYGENRVWVIGKESIGEVADAITFARKAAKEASEAELAKAQKTIKQLCVAHSSWALGKEAGVRDGIEMAVEAVGLRERWAREHIDETTAALRALLPAAPKD